MVTQKWGSNGFFTQWWMPKDRSMEMLMNFVDCRKKCDNEVRYIAMTLLT